MTYLFRVYKTNPYHDASGQFTSKERDADGKSGASVSKHGVSKNNDGSYEVQKKTQTEWLDGPLKETVKMTEKQSTNKYAVRGEMDLGVEVGGKFFNTYGRDEPVFFMAAVLSKHGGGSLSTSEIETYSKKGKNQHGIGVANMKNLFVATMNELSK